MTFYACIRIQDRVSGMCGIDINGEEVYACGMNGY